MNRIYKVIWNRVKNCYVVVSEIANNRGKINGRSTTCVGTLLCVLALVGGILSPLNTANAVNPAGTGAGVSWGNGTNSGTDQNNVAIGGYAQALGPVSLALGAHSNSSASYSTAIGGGTQSTAENATAIGGVAKAQGKNATAIGAKAEANGEYATTIGAGAKADKTYAIAIGSLSHATEVSSLAMGNNSKATNTYAYAIGGSAEAKGRWSIAMGTNAVAEDDASVSIGTWSKATTGQSVAVGYQANAKQLGATALGRQTNASAVDATAIGSGSNSTAENGTAIGKSASVSAKNSVAIGTGAKATNENAVALGTGSETATAVATASESVNGIVHNFAGINPGSTVSVGKTGMERTVTNVAAGRISATSTDAINGSQLYAVTTEVNKGTVYAGDVKGTGATDNKFTQRLGAQTNIVGGVADTSKLSDNNIGVVSNGTDTLNVKLAKTLTGLDSVTAGGTTINNSGLTVGGKTYVSPSGLNANDQKITNVADGTVGAGSKDAVNGGQLHDAKNELNTNISNAKTELINKGLRFDADNNDVKTNKLGSKVTVNGDGNITTEITQTGDDTTIGVKLNKNLNVQTLTATDTVKAGGVTMGKHADTKNYVTGLDNKDWDVNTSNPVSGRAATEDQLKKISDVVKSQGAAATDYRLVKNAAAADEAYTVDSNGDVDLTVEDKNHAGSKETVKIKDVASKSKLDKVINDGLKFDANTGGEKTNKLGSKVSVKGDNSNIITSISQDANGDSTIDVKLGKDLKTETITATGKDGKDGKIGINGKDGVTTNISVTRDGKPGVDGAAGTTTTRIVYQKPDGTNEEVANLNDGMMYGGDTGNVIKKKLNNQVNVKGGISDESKLATEDNIGVVSDGSDTLKLRLAKELKGLTSATFTNGGNNTVINGDGMTINRAGSNAVSLTKDGLNNGGNKITNVADGTDPNDAVNKSQLDKATAAASTTVSGSDNITVTPSTNANGSKNYEVSLKDKVTLGTDATKQIAIDGTTGTIKAGDKVTIDGNKGTIKAGNVTIDGENGTIKAGDKVTIDGKDGKIAAGKVSVDGKDGYVTGLENKDWDPDNITSGRAATEDQLQQSHKALDNKITNLGDEITKKGMNFAGNTGEFHRDLGQKVTIKGEGTESDDKYSGENIKTVADQDGNVTIKMAKNLKTDSLTTDKVKVGKNGKDGVSITGPNGADGTDGKVGITGKDGKDAVSMSGKDGVGHIGLTGKDGRNADITVDKGDPDLDGNNITRIKYQDENGKTHQVATKDDGMKYGGDSGSVIKKKLNEQVNVVGGITDASKLTTEDNLGVVSDGTGNLKVRMAKDLKGLETVTTKDAAGNTTVMNGGGVTITPASGNAVSLTKDGLNNGGNTITNVGPGVNGTDAVNVNQLKGATDGLANAINSVAGETQRVGAHAAAMSALKPIQYDPLEPTQVMAGIGNYRGETAAALGVAHYTAEDTMFHVGVSVGSHHNMVNAGVTRKFGTSDAKKAVPERYKGGPISSIYVMQDEMTALKAENARMQESLNELSSVKADNARMQQHDLELTAKYNQVQRDNEEMKAQIALLMQQVGLSK